MLTLLAGLGLGLSLIVAIGAQNVFVLRQGIRREHVLAVGGFDVSFRRAEDVELAYRLARRGLTFAYLPDAVGFHYADRSFDSWKAAAYTYGRNDVIFARDRGEEWIYPFMADKFAAHRMPLRALITSCIRWGPLRPAANTVLRWCAAGFDRFGSEPVASAAYSAIYGVEYHSGIADELGGSDRFFDVMRRRAT